MELLEPSEFGAIASSSLLYGFSCQWGKPQVYGNFTFETISEFGKAKIAHFYLVDNCVYDKSESCYPKLMSVPVYRHLLASSIFQSSLCYATVFGI